MTTPEAAFTTINALSAHINAASPEPARVRVTDGVQYVRGDIAERAATDAASFRSFQHWFWLDAAQKELSRMKSRLSSVLNNRGSLWFWTNGMSQRERRRPDMRRMADECHAQDLHDRRELPGEIERLAAAIAAEEATP